MRRVDSARTAVSTGGGAFNPFIPTQCLSANPLMWPPLASCVVVDIFKSQRALPRWGVGGREGKWGGVERWGGGVVPSLQSLGRGRPRGGFFPSWPKKEKEVPAEILTTESFKKGVGIMTEKRTKLALDKDNYTN